MTAMEHGSHYGRSQPAQKWRMRKSQWEGQRGQNKTQGLGTQRHRQKSTCSSVLGVPGTLPTSGQFFWIVSSLVLSPHAGLCSSVIFSQRPSLTTLPKITPSSVSLCPLTLLYFSYFGAYMFINLSSASFHYKGSSRRIGTFLSSLL